MPHLGVVAVVALAIAGLQPGAEADGLPPGSIETVAGGGHFLGDGGPALGASLYLPVYVVPHPAGGLLISDQNHGAIRRVAPSGIITTVAGGAFESGDGVPATAVALRTPQGIALDSGGNLYIAEFGNHRVRKVDPAGTITTVAGGGTTSANGVPATSARLFSPQGVAVDASGNLYIAEPGLSRIRKVDAAGVITTVAGTGSLGFSGDGGPAVAATFNQPSDVAVDAAGVLYVADRFNRRVRKIDLSGVVTTVAGNGGSAFTGDGGPATAAGLGQPVCLSLDLEGRLFIGDPSHHRIRRVDADGVISTVAGNGSTAFSGDGGAATAAGLSTPTHAAADADGNLYVADAGHHRIRRVDGDGVITTVAGGDDFVQFVGDGGQATAAFMLPDAVAFDAAGRLLVGDSSADRIRRVDSSGVITTVPQSSSRFSAQDIFVDSNGNMIVADDFSHVIRKIAPDGTTTTLMGVMGVSGVSLGNNFLPTYLNRPKGVAVDPAGILYVADTSNNRVVKRLLNGVVTGVLDSPTLSRPTDVALDSAGNVFIVDQGHHRVLKVAPGGAVTTVAGTGLAGYSGDGGPATSASLRDPERVLVGPTGHLFISDGGNHRVREVDSSGIIRTIAGNGVSAFSGDGGPATAASLNGPSGMALDAAGDLLIADRSNFRVRRVRGAVATSASISAPASLVQECDEGASGATVNFTFQVAAGSADLLRVRDVTGNRTLLQVTSPASGEYGVGPVTFPHGASSILIELSSGSTVLASATIEVHVEDTEAPVLSGCDSKIVEIAGPLTALTASLLGIGATDACDPTPSVTFSPNAVPYGTTSVTVTALDETGNASSCTFDVTVVDTSPPVFTVCPEDQERHCESDGVLVSFTVAADDLSGSVTITCLDETGRRVDPDGTLFGVGTHLVTCTAADPGGNTVTCGFLVDVVDDDEPVILCPDDVTVGNEPLTSFAYVSFAVTATDACDPDVSVLYEAPWGSVTSGDAFPVGTTTVVCTARDHSGNAATCSFNVTVRDVEAPRVSAPASPTLVTDCAGSVVALTADALGVTAEDNADPQVSITFSPATLGPGTADVVCTATDDAGNSASARLRIAVLRGPFQVRWKKPLDGYVDNVIQPGKTVPIKVRVSCDDRIEKHVTVSIDRVERIDGVGTAVANVVVHDKGGQDDDGFVLRRHGKWFGYRLSTKGWPKDPGARFRVVIRVRAADHVETWAEVVLRNR